MATRIRTLAGRARRALLKRRLTGIFSMGRGTRVVLSEAIYTQRAVTWRAVITEQAREAGSGQAGQGPAGRDERYLRQLSRDDARSIAETYNRELGNQIDRLVDQNPNADRAFYQDELVAWARQRQEYKTRQIANMNRSTARTYAIERFEDENRIEAATYVFSGPPPREPICAGLFQQGEVSQDVVRDNPTPIHINCPHWWSRTDTTLGVDFDDLWIGA